MAQPNSDGSDKANEPAPPTATDLHKAAGKIVEAIGSLPKEAQRSVLRSAHTLLGLDTNTTTAQRSQPRQQQGANNNQRGRNS